MEDKVSLAGSPRAGSFPSSSVPLYENRLSIPFFIRLPTATVGAFITGMALGLSHGSKTAGLRFRAENSHRFPTTSTGWYLYHKSKNYHAMLGGIKEGMKMGLKISFWTGSFFLVEEAVDRLRGTKDFMSTVVAGLSISGGFSAWNRFPLPTAARTSKVGLIGGLSYGLVQDALGLARGRRLGYVDFLLGRRYDSTNVNEVHS
ncbi:hypothetical protein JMJ35_008448 [Cladonia borealis]|uniref:Uncharacterized protein n=1 Tax=Cladonia borealis TaxID=184061 RepID=A0AA39QTR4_9LECA|nr:hypothetical protein JMJ35_008448 [Cladonia borealis]